MAMLYARCFVDVNDDAAYTPGIDDPLPCVLRFGQDVGLDAPVYTVLTLTTGIGGLSLWSGIYTAQVDSYAWQLGITPSAVYCPAFVFLNPGANMPFDCAFNEYAPVGTRTRTPTTTPIWVPTRTPTRTGTP